MNIELIAIGTVNVLLGPGHTLPFLQKTPRQRDTLSNLHKKVNVASKRRRLSYSKFEISDPKVQKTEISINDEVTVTARVKNTGDRFGQEVVQLYIRDEIASRVRPVKLLRGFRKIALEPGEDRQVEFTLGPKDFGFYDADGKLLLEPGRIQVMVGANSEELKSTAITLT